MGSYLQGVARGIEKIVEALLAASIKQLGIGVVAYRDMDDYKSMPIEKLTLGLRHVDDAHLAQLKAFTAGLKPSGGGFAPEDVAGGIARSLDLLGDSRAPVRMVRDVSPAFVSAEDSLDSNHPSTNGLHCLRCHPIGLVSLLISHNDR